MVAPGIVCSGRAVCIILLTIASSSVRVAGATMNMTAVLQTILDGYDNRIRPGAADYDLEDPNDCPLQIRTEIYIESVDSIRESTMDFSVTLYLRMFWQDSRLAFDGNRSLSLGSSGMEKIWLPDIYFLYEKEARVHTVTQPNRLMRIQPSGKISFSERISLTVACNMQLQKFPMDSQNCTIIVSSYAYPNEELTLVVDDQSIGVEPNITISKFVLTGMRAEHKILKFSIGNFSSVFCEFQFKRQMESYFLTVYIPTVLLVSIAWLSFWIDAKAAPARVALGITTVLTVTTMTAGIQETLPVVTYAKAIDIWLVVCLMFVFISLLEYGVANYLLCSEVTEQAKPATSTSKDDEFTDGQPVAARSHRMTAQRLDGLARFVYPIAFFSFAVCYWVVFLTM